MIDDERYERWLSRSALSTMPLLRFGYRSTRTNYVFDFQGPTGGCQCVPSSKARAISPTTSKLSAQRSAMTDGGLAILLSALTALYQMTYAGFFVHLNSIPQVLRWLQWMCPLKYALEALSVNEVKSGLQIKDVLQGVPVDVSATLIMELVRECVLLTYWMEIHSCFFLNSCLDSPQIIIIATC
jgi:hypothetical protein